MIDDMMAKRSKLQFNPGDSVLSQQLSPAMTPVL